MKANETSLNRFLAQPDTQYVISDEGKRVAVIIDLKTHGGLWEDFCGSLVADTRKNEPRETLDSVRLRVKKSKHKLYKRKFLKRLEEALSEVEKGRLVEVKGFADFIE